MLYGLINNIIVLLLISALHTDEKLNISYWLFFLWKYGCKENNNNLRISILIKTHFALGKKGF